MIEKVTTNDAAIWLEIESGVILTALTINAPDWQSVVVQLSRNQLENLIHYLQKGCMI